MLSINKLENRGIRGCAAAIAAAVALAACSSHLARVPPRLDLGNYDRVALITFSADQSKNALGTLATQRFAEEVLASQSGFELLELGPADSAVARLLAEGDAPAAAQELGRDRKIPAVFFGQLDDDECQAARQSQRRWQRERRCHGVGRVERAPALHQHRRDAVALERNREPERGTEWRSAPAGCRASRPRTRMPPTPAWWTRWWRR